MTEIREKDLAVTSQVRDQFEPGCGDFFVLTGSYSIESITGSGEVSHNDVDANIFTDNIARALGGAVRRLDDMTQLVPVKRTVDRLEYAYGDARLIELQFIAYQGVSLHPDGSAVFALGGESASGAQVPVAPAVLRGQDELYTFNVKTLPYAIATWALRISGAVDVQKRDVRQSDIDHFAILADTDFEPSAVYRAIRHHPQMPQHFDGRVEDILQVALQKAGLSKDGR